ncbi:MAG TPA: hypothetical protein VK208_20150 [Pyrinomonadaceae bacterium]|jgi:di/tricarboxylate transporter|nr:hypothetical protein [Pyrinomonadaceae bacterium]
MAKFQRIVSFLFWLLGLITTAAAIILRVLPQLDVSEKVEIRSLLWLAGVFFLGAIATRAVARWPRE